MMRIGAIATLGMLGTTLGMQSTAVQAPTGPLAPVGNWKVEYAENMCILSHSFGTGTSEVTLGFRPWPMGERTEVVLISRDSTSTSSRFGKGATLSLTSAGPGTEGDYWSYWLPKRKVRLVNLTVGQSAAAGLGSPRSCHIPISQGLPG